MGAIDTFTHDLPKSIKSFDTGNNVPFTYEAYALIEKKQVLDHITQLVTL